MPGLPKMLHICSFLDIGSAAIEVFCGWQAVQAEAQVNTDQKVRMEIMSGLSSMVDVEIPEFLITQVAQNEFQAKLFEVGQKVSSACL